MKVTLDVEVLDVHDDRAAVRAGERVGRFEQLRRQAGHFFSPQRPVHFDRCLTGERGAHFLAYANHVRRTLLDDALRAQAASLGDPDHKSALMLWMQARGRRLPEYFVISETGPEHRKRFAVEVRIDGRAVARGEGSSKKEAEQIAASLALAGLRDPAEAK